jgi:hypothetical protein
MPEGDTIYRAARALQKAIDGKVVTGYRNTDGQRRCSVVARMK